MFLLLLVVSINVFLVNLNFCILENCGLWENLLGQEASQNNPSAIVGLGNDGFILKMFGVVQP